MRHAKQTMEDIPVIIVSSALRSVTSILAENIGLAKIIGLNFPGTVVVVIRSLTLHGVRPLGHVSVHIVDSIEMACQKT